MIGAVGQAQGEHMVIRKYRSSDCRALAELFYHTVHTVNAKDYTKEQLNAWADGNVDLEAWNQSLTAHYSIVALDGTTVIGFGDIDKTGYLDRLYVHEDYQRKGVATAICNELEQTVQGKIITHASITARPFFEKRGYRIIREQSVERQGIFLTNFVMIKEKNKKPDAKTMLTIRNEAENDYAAVEKITRDAFYNQYIPGCTEHYLVHIMRSHEDFIPELDLVAELGGEIIGNIMYTKASLTDESGVKKDILTFGPICVKPAYQRKGYGKMLMAHSFEKARELGYDVIVIFGSPANYVSSGFISCKKYNICLEGDKYPTSMLVKELKAGALDGRKWYYRDSPVMAVNEADAEAYDDTLEKMEKKHQPSQEEFYIMSHSFVE